MKMIRRDWLIAFLLGLAAGLLIWLGAGQNVQNVARQAWSAGYATAFLASAPPEFDPMGQRGLAIRAACYDGAFSLQHCHKVMIAQGEDN